MVKPILDKTLEVILADGPIHVRKIGEKIGSLNHLTENLALLESRRLVKSRFVGNRHEYIITRMGKRFLQESKDSAVVEDLAELHKILMGRLVVRGSYRFELRPDGTVWKFSMRNPDGSWYVRDQRTEEEKKKVRW
jgi:DNA-binding PadR family transcriptional regulator